MKCLSLQRQYKNEIKAEADKILNTTYFGIEKRQNELFDKVLERLESKTDNMVKMVDESAAACKKAAENSGGFLENIFKIEGIFGLILASSPLFVLGHLIFRIYQHFA